MRLLRANLAQKRQENAILRKAKITMSAFKITSFVRKVADWKRRDKHYKAAFNKIRGLLYGYKLRKILKLDKMVDLKQNIEEISRQIEFAETEGQVQRLEHELLYQKKLFCNLIDKYWEKGFSIFHGKNSAYRPDYLTETLIKGAAKTAKKGGRMSHTDNLGRKMEMGERSPPHVDLRVSIGSNLHQQLDQFGEI